MEFYQCLAAVKRRFWCVAAITVFAAISSWIVSHYVMQNVYQSTASIIVSRPNAILGVNEFEQQNELLNSNYIKMYYTLGNSESVIQSIIKKLQLDTTVKKLREQINIVADYDTGIIKISVMSDSTNLSTKIAQVFIESLKEQSSKLSIGAEISVIDEPTTPKQPVSPNIILNILLSAAAGILAGLLLVLYLGSKDISVNKIPDLAAISWLAPLGFLPKLKNSKRNTPIIVGSANRRAFEAVKIARTNLQYVIEREAISSIMITSPDHAQGSSTVALNIALSMVQLKKRVLLIDCHFRKPGLNKICDVEKYKYTKYSLEQHPNEYCTICNVPSLGIDLILDLAPTWDYVSESGLPWLQAFLYDVALSYDLAILDCPPILPYADSLMLCRVVQNVVLVADYSRLAASVLEKSAQSLKQIGGNILGVVVNKVPASKIHSNMI